MNRGIQAVGTSMANSETWLDVTANNLANISTNGFKRDGMSFQSTLQQVNANGGLGASVNDISTGTVISSPYSTLSEIGPMTSTGNPLDVALKTPSALFGVEGPNGQISYTRDGSFTLDPNRNLVTQTGMKVLDSSKNPIQIPGAGQISISNTGQITLTDTSGVKNVAQLGAFVGPVQKAGNNLYSATGEMASADSPQFASGTVEGSNVNPIEAMLDLIKIGRTYELQQKSISSQDQLSQKLTTTIG